MRAEEKRINDYCTIMSNFIKCCAETDDREKRLKYERILLLLVKDSRRTYIKNMEMFNDMINKLTDAGKTISEQNDWIEYLGIAMEDKKEELFCKAKLEKEAVERYKRKIKKEV